MHAGLEKGDRVGLWSPNYAEWTLVQFATAEIGVILVNINPAYRTHELAFVLNQSGCRWIIAAPEFKTSNYVAMVAEVADQLPALERAVFFWTDEWNHLTEGDEMVSDDELVDAARVAAPRRSDQHPVHVGHDRVPEGRHAHAPQHPQQRLLHGRAAGLHPRTTGCASPCPSTTASGW